MIRKLISFFFFGFLVVSLFLYIGYGVVGPVNFGSGFRQIFSSAMQAFEKVKFAIPEIPSIPPEVSSGNDFFSFFINLGNFFVQLFNASISLLNAFIEIITFINCLANAILNFLVYPFPRITPVPSLPGSRFVISLSVL